MILLKRILANLVDILVFFTLFVLAILYLQPVLAGFSDNNTLNAIIITVVVIAVTTGLQIPFILVNQTLGKAFFRLKIVSTDSHRPLTPGIIVQRELFAKVASGYLLCLPVLIGKRGGHEVVTETGIE